MKQIYMMMGNPGAGKSTFVKQLQKGFNQKNKTTQIVSRDQIRFSLLKPGDAYFSKEKQVFKMFINQINDALSAVDIIIIDATHLTVSARQKVLTKIIKTIPYELNIVWIKTSLEQSLLNNETRKGTKTYVPIDTIKSMFNSIEEPIMEEGLSNLIIKEWNKPIRIINFKED